MSDRTIPYVMVQKMKQPIAVKSTYERRNPTESHYYRCIEANFEELERAWDDRYKRRYGYWRPYIMDVIYRYLDCGDLHFGSARVRCKDCGHEYLLAYSCKRRHFCPSCHQKRVVEFGEWLCAEVLKYVPHRQWVFSIPKRLRIYYMFDRRLLAGLSRCVWKVLSLYLTEATPLEDAKAGAVIISGGLMEGVPDHSNIVASAVNPLIGSQKKPLIIGLIEKQEISSSPLIPSDWRLCNIA